jgi:NAD/NADP transhydrogenase alpha subunit
MDDAVLLGAYVFILAIFLGLELIGRVPSTLHTPLMSATNAIHGIVLLGAMLVLGAVDEPALRTAHRYPLAPEHPLMLPRQPVQRVAFGHP